MTSYDPSSGEGGRCRGNAITVDSGHGLTLPSLTLRQRPAAWKMSCKFNIDSQRLGEEVETRDSAKARLVSLVIAPRSMFDQLELKALEHFLVCFQGIPIFRHRRLTRREMIFTLSRMMIVLFYCRLPRLHSTMKSQGLRVNSLFPLTVKTVVLTPSM